MIKKLPFLWLAFCSAGTYAQAIKTDVLVIGGSPSGVAAAIQCARSKVKTILAAHHIQLAVSSGKVTITENAGIPSGIWGEFRHHVRDLNKIPGLDTAYDSPLIFEKDAAEPILQKMMDTVKNLTLDLNASFTSIKKDGDRWEVHFLRAGNDMEIKARVVVDATKGCTVVQNAGAKPDLSFSLPKVTYTFLWYRTSIACGWLWPGDTKIDNTWYPFWIMPLAGVVAHGAENLLTTENEIHAASMYPAGRDNDFLPVQLQLGQGVGALAAYCAFFKTTTANLKVRVIQGELLDFKGYLLPFSDIRQNDPDWRAIQQVGATGLLRGESDGSGKFVFMPNKLVSTAEIQPVLQEIYTRAFLWFNREKPGEKFTIGNTLSFISDYTLTDPAILKAGIQKAWQTQFKFKSDFDMSRPITRREFAVLANRYLNPFARTVDLSGRLVN